MPHDPTAALQALQTYAEAVRTGSVTDRSTLEPMLLEAVQEFQNALEELRVSGEELRQQNDELSTAWQMAEAGHQRYEELFDFAPDGYLVTDGNGTIRQVNRAVAGLLGVPQELLVGKPFPVFVPEDHRRPFRAWMEKLAHASGEQEREMWLKPRHGDGFPASVKVRARRDPTGQVAHLLWTVRDIRKRVAAEEALRRERDFAESLVETAEAVVLVLDLEGRVIRFNPYLEEMTGYELNEVRGQDWFEVFVPAPARAAARAQFLMVGGNGEIRHGIQPILTRDGHERQIHWSTKHLREGADRPETLLATGHDITQLNQAQQRALQAERLAAIGQMVSGLSHEGRNALQRSQACLEMLRLDVRDRPSALNLVDRVQAAQNHLLGLYEEVQGYAAPVRLNRKACSLGDLVHEAFDRIVLLHKGRRLVLRDEPTELDLQCEVDAPLVRRVFCNILDNAAGACGEPAEVILCWAETDVSGRPAVQAALRDNGPGLTAEQREKIFEPFFTTKTHGIGLGMAVARRIVEAHEGRIAVGSPQGPGTEILVALPRRRP